MCSSSRRRAAARTPRTRSLVRMAQYERPAHEQRGRMCDSPNHPRHTLRHDSLLVTQAQAPTPAWYLHALYNGRYYSV